MLLYIHGGVFVYLYLYRCKGKCPKHHAKLPIVALIYIFVSVSSCFMLFFYTSGSSSSARGAAAENPGREREEGWRSHKEGCRRAGKEGGRAISWTWEVATTERRSIAKEENWRRATTSRANENPWQEECSSETFFCPGFQMRRLYWHKCIVQKNPWIFFLSCMNAKIAISSSVLLYLLMRSG